MMISPYATTSGGTLVVKERSLGVTKRLHFVLVSILVHVVLFLCMPLPSISHPLGRKVDRRELLIRFEPSAELDSVSASVTDPTPEVVPEASIEDFAPPVVGMPPPEPEQTPIPESEKLAAQPPEQPPAVPQPNLGELEPFEKPRTALVYDRSKGDSASQQDAKYVGETNSVAADMAKKDKPLGDPSMLGESSFVRFSGRRGETGTSPEKPQEIMAGKATAEGSVEPGKPPEPLTGTDEKSQEVEGGSKVLPPEAEKETPLTPALPLPLPSDGKLDPITHAPTPLGEPVPLKPQSGALSEGGVERAGTDADLLVARDTERHAEKGTSRDPVPGTLQPQHPAVPLVAPPDPSMAVAGPRKERLPVPESAATTKSLQDPELKRLEALLAQHSTRAAFENARLKPGQGPRAGDSGVQGDGRTRSGDRQAVSDVITDNYATVAAKTGEVSFAKAASPEAVYLKEYLGRVNENWKRNVIAAGRIRWEETGVVEMHFTLSRDGKLEEAAERSRAKGLSDQAVAHCKRAFELSAPHDAFPASLGERQKVSLVVRFLY